MPQNLGNIAYTTARALATENGFTDGVNGVSVTVSPGARSNQLKVVISEPVTNLFGAIAGYPTTTVAKHAVAEYERPVALGSPTNQFGNDPTIVPAPAHGTPQYPDLWANVAGPKSEKNKGDATLANVCSASGDHPDNCSNSSAGPNTDYNPKGYYYTIDVGPAASSPLDVQVFDPAFVHVGDNCGDDSDPAGGMPTSKLKLASQLPANFNSGFPMTAADIALRYSPLSTSLFCTGDNAFLGNTEGKASGTSLVPWTTYRVLGPDDTPADPTNNPPVAGCPAIDFPGTAGNLNTLLTSTTPIAGAPATLVKYFRQWYGDLHGEQPDRRRVLLASADRDQGERQCRTGRRWAQPVLDPGGVGRKLRDRQRQGLRPGQDVDLRERAVGRPDLLSRAGAAGCKGARAGAELLRHRRRGAEATACRSSHPPTQRRRRGTNHELGRLHLHAAAGQYRRSTLGGVRGDTGLGQPARSPESRTDAPSTASGYRCGFPYPTTTRARTSTPSVAGPRSSSPSRAMSPTPPHGRRTSKATPCA